MTDPWAQVATALGHDRDEEGPAGDTPSPSGWATVAERLSSRTGTDQPVPARRGRGAKGSGPVPATATAVTPEATPEAAPAETAADLPAARLARRRPKRSAAEPDVADAGEAPGRARLAGARRRVVAAVVVAVLAVVGLVLYLVWPAGGLPAGTAMSVGGRNVSVSELNGNINVLTHFYGIAAPSQSDRAAYATYLHTEAKAYAIDLIVQQQAPRQHVSVSAAQVDDEYNALVKNVAGGDASKLDQLFSQYGLTEAQVRDQIRFQLLEVALYNKVVGSPSISDAQVQQTFHQNTQALTVPETRAVSHIVVADQNTAQSILTQLQQGASFAQLAASDSLDTGSKANGGALGTHAQEELSQAFGQAAFSAPPNVPFGPVDEGNSGTTRNGYDVGLVTAVNPGHPPTDDAATQKLIRTYLVGVAKNGAWQRWLTGALRQAHVRYAPTYRPTDPSAAPPTQAPTLRQLVLQAADGTSSAPPAGPTP
jgi:hypothetical protein